MSLIYYQVYLKLKIKKKELNITFILIHLPLMHNFSILLLNFLIVEELKKLV